jgi:hypothetical protein
MLPLDLFKLPHQPIILGVGDLGLIKDIVQVVVIFDVFPEFFGSLF